MSTGRLTWAKYNEMLEFLTSMERQVGVQADVYGEFGLDVHSTIARVGGREDVQLRAKAEPGFVCWGTISKLHNSLLWLHTAGLAGLSTMERNPTRGGLAEFKEN